MCTTGIPDLLAAKDLMRVKSIAECSNGEHSAILHWSILQYLRPSLKRPFVINIFVLSISEWLLKTDFTVLGKIQNIFNKT